MRAPDLTRPVSVRLWGVAVVGVLLALSLIANVFALAWSDSASDTASRTETLVQPILIRNSACAREPRGAECQAIFANSIRAFDRKTACLLARKLGIDCIRRNEGSDRAPTSTDKESTEPRPGADQPGGAGGGGRGGFGGGGPGGESPDGQPGDPGGGGPPPGNGPGGPGGPAPGPAPSDPTLGSGVGKAIDGALEGDLPKVVEGTGEGVAGAKAGVCERLGTCLP